MGEERAKVTLEHPDGTVESTELAHDGYIVLTGPDRYIAGEQHYPGKGTVVITIKREASAPSPQSRTGGSDG